MASTRSSLPGPEPEPQPRLVAGYRRLVRLYPCAHRERFGDEMTQLFRDQWRSVTARGGLTLRAAFVVRSALDFATSCLREHAAALRCGFMHTPRRPSLLMPMLAGALVAGLVMAFTAAVLTLLPRVYLSTTHILIYPPPPAAGTPAEVDPFWMQTQFEICRSAKVLTAVVEDLGLAERWSKEYLVQGTLHVRQAVEILANKIEVRQFRNTSMVEVRAYDRDPRQAAEIANAMGAAILRLRVAGGVTGAPQAQLTDLAEPGLRPVRPNVYLGGFLGALTGLGLGAVTGLVLWWVRRHRVAPTPPKSLA